MSKNNDYRIIKEADLYINGERTVRKVAKMVGVSKSTVYRDLTELLPSIDQSRYIKVDVIMMKNKRQRHIRGGEATKRKYQENK